MRRTTRLAIPALILIAASVGTGGQANAETGSLGRDDHCGTGSANAITNAFYPLFWNADGKAGDDVTRCQFRLFAEPPAGICFDELDHFVGGIVWFDEPSNRESLDRLEFDVRILELGSLGPELIETPIKALRHPSLGNTVWKQWSVTLGGLTPGSYTAVTSLGIDGSFVEEFTVEFHVLPHDDAHALGTPESGLEGSVICPPEVLS